MTNAFVDGILSNITLDSLNGLLGSDELRDFKGKRLKELNDNSYVYVSMREFAKFSNMRLHSGVLTSLLHSSMPECCIVRLTKNVTYILIYIDNGKSKIAFQSELSKEMIDEYKERIK